MLPPLPCRLRGSRNVEKARRNIYTDHMASRPDPACELPLALSANSSDDVCAARLVAGLDHANARLGVGIAGPPACILSPSAHGCSRQSGGWRLKLLSQLDRWLDFVDRRSHY